MTKQVINTGTAANSKNGDSLRTAFTKINANFTELYATASADLQIPTQSGNNGKYLTTNGSALSWATTPSTDRLINATDKIVLNEEGATRLSMYLNNVEKTRIQINGNDLLLSSLSGGVVLAATDGVGGEWRFKTNGNLESTGGNFLSAAESPAVFGSLNSTSTGTSSGTVTLKSGTGDVDGGSIYIEAGTGGSGNDGEVTIRTGSTPYEWLFDNGGILTVPGRITLGTDAFIVGNGDFAGLYPSSTSSSAGLELDAVNDALLVGTRNVIIRANGASPWKSWTFKSTGDLQLPGNLQSNGNIDIEINLADSTMRRWSFGEDGILNLAGNLTFADSTIQSTAWTGNQTVSTTSSVKFNTVRSNILAPLTTGATQYTISNIAPETPWTNPVITITGTIGPEWVNGSQLEITGVTTPTQANGTWYVQYRSANSFRLFNDAGLTSSPNASGWAAYTGSGIVKLPDSPANLTVVNNSNTWSFGTNGILTVPGDINASGMIGEFGSVKANYLSHVTGTTQIQIGDGDLANGKTIIITDQRVRIMAAVPSTSIGSSGDNVGSVAFNSTYMYYCTAAYDGVTNIWKRVAWSGSSW